MEDGYLLFRATKKLDHDMLTAAFDNHASAIYVYALRFCGDPLEADRIVGRVFAKFLEKVSVGKATPINLRAYLYQLAYHYVTEDGCCVLHLAFPKMVSRNRNEISTGSLNPEASAFIDKFVSSFSNSLSELQQHVIILRFLEDFSVDETATIMGTTANQVRAIQNLGLAILRSYLDLLPESKE